MYKLGITAGLTSIREVALFSSHEWHSNAGKFTRFGEVTQPIDNRLADTS